MIYRMESRHRVFLYQNVAMLSLYAELPLFPDHVRRNKESEQVYQQFFACAEVLAAKAQKAYLQDPSPRRRFTHRPDILTYTAKVTYEDEALLSLSYSFVWRRGATTVAQHTDGDTFRKKDGKRLSLWQCSARKERKEKHLRLFSRFFLDEKGKVVRCT